MARSVVLALFAAAAAVVALQACTTGPGREDVGIQRLQTLLCDKARECGCRPSTNALGEPIACGDWYPPPIGDFDPVYGYRNPRAFDPDCVEHWAGWVEEQSCQAAELPSYADLCPLYHGVLVAGEGCDESFSVVETDCGRGLFCLGGTCRDPQRTNFGGEGEPCDVGERCDSGLTCGRLGQCVRVPGPGEPCLDGYRCNAESRCVFDVCEALPGPGAPCVGGECVPGSFCDADPNTGDATCRLALPTGAPCRGHRQCASGNCPAGVCMAPADLGEPCGSQLPCGPGLTCGAGMCVAGVGGGGLSACDLLGSL